jgi:hydroxylaminobenzene mutase
LNPLWDAGENKMNGNGIRIRLVWHGVFIFFIGLLTGLLVNHLHNPRMGMAAHVEAILNGMFLILYGGIIWNELRLSNRISKALLVFLIYASYFNWFFILLAAIFGTSKLMPIAGKGYTAPDWHELIVNAGISTVVLSILLATVITLYGLGRRIKHQN